VQNPEQVARVHTVAVPVMRAQARRVVPGTARRHRPPVKRVPAGRRSDRPDYRPASAPTLSGVPVQLMNLGDVLMTKQKTPHTQTEQNIPPTRADVELDQAAQGTGTESDEQLYSNMEGAETGGNRTPKRPSQGITSHSAEEESERQQKVVNDRPDAQAGVNHSK
jgi:hypothetical protein